MLSQLLRFSPSAARSHLQITRLYASVTKMQVHRVSPHLTLQRLDDQQASRNASLVLFFPFLGASTRALRQYQDLYLSRGHHVLTVNCQLKQFLLPSLAREIAVEALNYLSTDDFPAGIDRYFVHSMSIGAFIYDVVMKEMQQEKYSSIQPKIIGQIFDSLTMGGLENMITGVAQKVSNPIGRALVTMGTKSYLWATKKYTVDYYDELVDFFKEAPIRTPVLLFYSLNDPLLCPDTMEEMIKKWKAMNDPRLEVFSECWPISKHALHLRSHPNDYHAALKSFLLRIGLEIPPSRL